jgi:hypothetical protein
MFDGEANAHKKAQKIVRRLTDYRGNRTHQRHIGFDELAAMDLKITRLEDVQWHQDLVLTVHHCYMHALMNTPAFKIIENQKGSAFVKQQAVQQIAVQQRP